MTHITAAIEYVRQGRNAEAFVLLSEKEAEKDPSARFALGLCHLCAGDESAAISCFEQALRLLKASASPGLSAVQKTGTENTETYQKLMEKQIADKLYLTPMDADFCSLFPRAAEQTILLALTEVYCQKGMIEQARRLSSGLSGPAFEVFKKELFKNEADGV